MIKHIHTMRKHIQIVCLALMLPGLLMAAEPMEQIILRIFQR